MDSPLNQAHQHATNAEEYQSRGLLVNAAEEHYRAAELFQRALEGTSDEGTKRTLRMLCHDHNKEGKELQRRITDLRAKGKDPTQPQVPMQRQTIATSPHVLSLGPQHSQPKLQSHSSSRLADSQMPIGESYMVLDGQPSDPSEQYRLFFDNLQGLLEQYSSPVAFATAPLFLSTETQGTPHEATSNTDAAVRDSSGLSGKLDAMFSSTPTPQINHAELRLSLTSTLPSIEKVASDSTDKLVTELDEDDSSSSDSFYFIPATPDSNTLESENLRLKTELADISRKLASAEKLLALKAEQEQHLRQGISQARRDMQRTMIASGTFPARPPIMDMNFPNLNIPGLPQAQSSLASVTAASHERETPLIRRTRELEAQVRAYQEENAKQRDMIIKFKEKWTKLKDSARRKKNARASAEGTGLGAQEPIDEEPDKEAAETELV